MDKRTAKSDKKIERLLRHLHILDTLANDSLEAQLRFIERTIQHPENQPQNVKLKKDASKKYSWFDETKRSLLKSDDFIDNISISNNDEVKTIIRRCNITVFLNLLFANFEPDIPDLPNVDYRVFFNHVVPKPEEAWDLDLNLRVQIFIYKVYKNPQKKIINTMFPKEDEVPSTYQEKYKKVYERIKNYSGDIENLMKEFKWNEFAKKMCKFLSNIASGLNRPLLYKYTSIRDPSISSPSLTNKVTIESEEADSSATLSRSTETDGLSTNQNDLQINNESSTSALSQETKHKQVSDSNWMIITRELSSNSIISQLSELEEMDDRQSELDELDEDRSRLNRKSKKRAIENLNTHHENEIKRMTKRVKNMWSKQELNVLEKGMRQYGKAWASIKKDFGSPGQVLESRSQIQLKDKARSEYLRRIREGIEPGVFGIMEN